MTGFFAAEGTAFHEWADDCMRFDLQPENLFGSVVSVPSGWATNEDGDPIYIDAEIDDPDAEDAEVDVLDDVLGTERKAVKRVADHYEFVMDEEFARHMRKGLAWIRAQAANAILVIEQRVDLSPWLGRDHGGTSDIGIADIVNREIIIFDWKYGAGVPVSPIENYQLLLYCLGVWHTWARALFEEAGIGIWDIKVRIVIWQPRAPGGGGEWSEWTMGDVLEWGAWVRARSDMSATPGAPRTAGEKQCIFCKARHNCGTLAEYLVAMVDLKFDDLDDALELDYAPRLVPAMELTAKQRAFIHRNAGLFRNWLDSVHSSLVHDYMTGEDTPGVKMVMSNKGRRAYVPEDLDAAEDLAVSLLGEDAYQPRKLKTPAQIEKVLPAEDYKKLSAYVRQADGKPTLVSSTDARKPVPRLEDKFDVLPPETEEE